VEADGGFEFSRASVSIRTVICSVDRRPSASGEAPALAGNRRRRAKRSEHPAIVATIRLTRALIERDYFAGYSAD